MTKDELQMKYFIINMNLKLFVEDDDLVVSKKEQERKRSNRIGMLQ